MESVRLLADRGQRTVQYGDQALLELQARRAWHLDLLVGPYSRFGWHHPGPSLAYLLAAPVRLVEPDGPGLYLGAMVIDGCAAVLTVAWMWRRHGHKVALWTAVVVDLLVICVSVAVLRYPWNPYLIVLPVLLMVVLWADAMRGHLGALVWSAVVASYVAQTHISAAPFAVGLILAAAISAVVHHVRGRPSELARRSTAAGVAVLILAWVAPAVELWRDHPDNIALLWRYLDQPQVTPTARAAVHQALNAVTVVPFTFHPLASGVNVVIARQSAALVEGLALLVGAGLAATVVGWRRRLTQPALLVGAGAVGVVVGAFVNMRSAAPLQSYLVIWMAFVPAAVLIAVGTAVLAPAGTTGPGMARRSSRISLPAHPPGHLPAGGGVRVAVATPVLVVLAAVAAVWTTGADLHQRAEWRSNDSTVAAFTAAAAAALHPSDRVVGVDIVDAATWPTAAGVTLGLVRAGRTTTVTPASWTLLFGGERAPDRPVSATFFLYQLIGGIKPSQQQGRVVATSDTEVLTIARS